MKRLFINKLTGALALSLCFSAAIAQEAEKSSLVLTLSYYSANNSAQYVAVNAKTKVDKRFQPVKGEVINLFLNKDSAGQGLGLIGKVITDEKGNASTVIPVSLAQVWQSTPDHTFIAIAKATKQFDETTSELVITKARLTIDTADDKNVTATLSEFKNNEWLPVKGVEMKLGIKRLGSDLQMGDEQTYTTDSLGHITGEFKKLGIPGDKKGGIILVAKIEDNDQYGNLRVERSEPWGKKAVATGDFFHRALWASRFHSPVWLVAIAYSIIITVWGVIIYLIFLLFRIKKLGKQAE